MQLGVSTTPPERRVDSRHLLRLRRDQSPSPSNPRAPGNPRAISPVPPPARLATNPATTNARHTTAAANHQFGGRWAGSPIEGFLAAVRIYASPTETSLTAES